MEKRFRGLTRPVVVRAAQAFRLGVISVIGAIFVIGASSCATPAIRENQTYPLPSLRVTGRSGTLTALCNGFVWPDGSDDAGEPKQNVAGPGGTGAEKTRSGGAGYAGAGFRGTKSVGSGQTLAVKQVDSRAVPSRPFYLVAAAPGDNLDLTISGIDKIPVSIALELVDPGIFNASNPASNPWEPLISASLDVSKTSLDGSVLTFHWIVPLEGPGASWAFVGLPKEYCLKVTACWDLEEIEEQAEVQYLCRFTIAEANVIDETIAMIRRFSEAAWTGAQQEAASLIPEWDRGENTWATQIPARDRLFYCDLGDSWDSILWRSDELSFERVTEPAIYLRNLAGITSAASTRVEAVFRVRVTDDTGKSGVWTFTEDYLIDDRSDRPIRSMDRRGKMVYSADMPSAWEPAAVRDGQVMKIGPFSKIFVPRNTEVWSDDGRYLAFVVDQGEESGGIWVVSDDGTIVQRVFSLDAPSAPIGTPYIHLLGWAPGEHRIRFIVSGFQTGFGHADEWGMAFAEVEVATDDGKQAATGDAAEVTKGGVAEVAAGSVRTICFVPAEDEEQSGLRDLNVTADRTHAFFRISDDLWRVNLETGQTTMLFEEVRDSRADHFYLRYSPTGWRAALPKLVDGQPILSVYDLKTGLRNDINMPGGSGQKPGELRPFFWSWTPDELLIVPFALSENIERGGEAYYPIGSNAVEFYSTDGRVMGRLSCDDATIGEWTWSSDGKSIAYTVGAVSRVTPYPSYSSATIGHRTEEIWIQRDVDGTPELLFSFADAGIEPPDESLTSLEWVDDDTALELWYTSPQRDGKGVESGFSVSLAGSVSELSRSEGNLGLDVLLGSIGDTHYYIRRDSPLNQRARDENRVNLDNSDSQTIFARDGQGNETLIAECERPVWVHDAHVRDNLFWAYSGNGYAGMLGEEGYIYIHRP